MGQYLNKLTRDCPPYQSFKPIEIKASPFIKEHPGSILINPIGPDANTDFGFQLTVNKKPVGSWTILVSYTGPSFWRESNASCYLHGYDFDIEEGFRRHKNPQNWYAVAFRQAVQSCYLLKAYPGWILDANVTHKGMYKVFKAAHGIDHEIKHAEDSWQLHAFMRPLPENTEFRVLP